MKKSSIPTKFPIAWANNAASPYVRQIPSVSQILIQPGAASFPDGFPPLTLTPINQGGVPPFGEDANGILKQITQNEQWTNAGGVALYDVTFATTTGGYPLGAIVQSPNSLQCYLSIVDNNLTNPDSGSTSWVQLSFTGVFNSVAVAEAISIPSTQTSFITLGYYNPGDGGGTQYIHGPVSNSGGFQSADGQWWKPVIRGPISVRAFGAFGNASTDDTTAFLNAVAAITVNGGGTLLVPAGNYLVSSTITIGPGINIISDCGDNAGVIIQTGNVDVTVFLINGVATSFERLNIAGGGIGATTPVVHITAGAVECSFKLCRITGGFNCVLIDTPNVADVIFFGCRFTDAYGTAIVSVSNGPSAVFFIRHDGDQNFPVATPSRGSSLSGRLPNTFYNVGAIASTGGYYIQARVAGTTNSGTGPRLKNYGVDMTDDGSVVWQLVAPTTYYSIQFDTASFSNAVYGADFTGPFTAGVAMTNSLSGTPPSTLMITDSFFGGNITAGVSCTAGNDLTIKGCQIQSPISSGGVGIWLHASYNGDTVIDGNTIFTCPIGVQISSGINTLVRGNLIYGCSTAAVSVDANVMQFTVDGNSLGSSTTWGQNQIAVLVNTGSSDYYNIVNNIVHGANTGVSDSGSGTHKTLTGNV